jgi:7-cyano-7-deazaguanine synthase
MTRARAIVLLSGGLDSATLLAFVRSQDYEIYTLTFRYGQRHAGEVEAAAALARAADVAEHKIAEIDLRLFGRSALTDDLPVPKDHPSTAGEIPITYVPARNTIFLSFALAHAEVREARDIFIGVNAVDYSGYPDCRPEYLEAFGRMSALATRAGVQGNPVRIHAPFMRLSKAEIVRQGLALGVDYAQTRSCYDPDAQGRACGHCDSCRLRLAAFAAVGIPDPATYHDRAT